MVQANVELLSGDQLEQKSFKDRLKMVMSGLSGAFTFPIATLAVLSIFLALGGFFESLTSAKALKMIGGFIKALAFPVLQALPLLFCVAFTASFCKNDFACVWGSVIAYLVFLSVQSVFIWPESDAGTSQTVSSSNVIDNVRVPGYVVLFPSLGRDKKVMLNLVDRTLGFTALNTSVFGALMLGGVMIPYIQRNFSNVTLPGPLAFFSGKRFIPVLASLAGTWLAMMFLTFWPWVGRALSFLGQQIEKTPYGIDSFLFGFIEKSLIPFGLHHAFYAPLWYSSLGGDVVASINEHVSCGTSSALTLGSGSGSSGVTSCSSSDTTSQTAKTIYEHITRPTSAAGYLWNLFSGARISHAMWKGDSFIGASAISLPSNEVKISGSGSGSGSSMKVMEFFKDKLKINVGRFTQGKYPVMQYGLPCAGLAMLYAAPKENREEASKVIFPGILSSLLMGITEPLEFTFLFLAPKLFYGFHAVCCGVSFALMNVLGAHMPSIFSGGLIEAILLGILPYAKGTNFHVYFVVGGLLAPLYFTVFSVAIRVLDLKTPGRDISVVSKVADEANTSNVPEQTRQLALGFGGWDNLEKMSNCASRLRYDIVDKSKVNEAILKSAGVIAVKWVGDNHVQAIVGPKAEAINNEMLKWRGEDLGG